LGQLDTALIARPESFESSSASLAARTSSQLIALRTGASSSPSRAKLCAWLEKPMALTRIRLLPISSSASSTASSTCSTYPRASNSVRPGAGESSSTSR
jgi:hypothetical protein